jgi:Fe-S-cluster containining protein
MSLCDTCAQPGRCCSGFMLNGGSWPPAESRATALEVLGELASISMDEPKELGLPFLPLYRRPNDGSWLFWCPNLDLAGRCGDYENRPHLCRSLEPASDRLCIYWKPIAEKCEGCLPFADRPTLKEANVREPNGEAAIHPGPSC